MIHPVAHHHRAHILVLEHHDHCKHHDHFVGHLQKGQIQSVPLESSVCNFLKRGQGHLHTKSVIVFVYGYWNGLLCKLYVNILYF